MLQPLTLMVCAPKRVNSIVTWRDVDESFGTQKEVVNTFDLLACVNLIPSEIWKRTRTSNATTAKLYTVTGSLIS